MLSSLTAAVRIDQIGELLRSNDAALPDLDLVARCRGRLRRIAHCPRGDWALAAFPEIALNHGSSPCRSAGVID